MQFAEPWTLNVDLTRFPDGLKSSGQHPPLYDKIQPYHSFPKIVTGPTVWDHGFVSQSREWTYFLSGAEIKELSDAADSFMATGHSLTGITSADFPLPTMSRHLKARRDDLLNGKGFVLYKGIPVQEWGSHKCAVVYMGMGSYIGHAVSQNGRGHILGHVKDLGEDSTQIDKTRIYRTNARQFFHTDNGDIVGLLCLAKAQEGGESDVASVHQVWNILQAEYPAVAELFCQPTWYFDRKGEVSKGEDEYIRAAVFYLETVDDANPSAEQRIYCKWDPYYIRSLTRLSDKGIIPPVSKAQEHAMEVLEQICNRVKLHMILDVGDIQFLSNNHVLHARTAYKDYLPDSGMARRHLMRLWLSVPVGEGGWRVPFADADHPKRNGIQVDDVPPVANLDAD